MVPDAWLKRALEITGGFETAGDPWSASAGDFDGMGLSCGALQWNIGAGTLQPLITSVGEAKVMAAMPCFGADLWRAVTGPRAAALAITRSWQTKNQLRPDVTRELAAFLATPAMIDAQMRAAKSIARKAEALTTTWAAARQKPASQRDFCWFFDLVTQNGSLKGLGPADVARFVVAQGSTPAAMAAICEHLAAMPISEAGVKDAHRNAKLWRSAVDEPDLFILAHLRAARARAGYRAVVMNRKGAIAAGRGWVNGEMTILDGC